MANLMTQKNLLLLLAVLLGVKFLLIPLIEWQDASIDALDAASRQLSKVERVIAAESRYRDELEVVRAQLESANSRIYEYSDTIKLDIQRDLEELFVASGGLTVTGFNWVADSSKESDSVRVLRGIVYFSGPLSSMIETFWAMGASSKVIRIVDWRQQVQSYGLDVLGGTSGNVTLEFFVLPNVPKLGNEVMDNVSE